MDTKSTKQKRNRQANGTLPLSNLSRSIDDFIAYNEPVSPAWRCACNGTVQHGGSRTNLVNVVQPRVNYDTHQGDDRRQRRLGCSLENCNDDEEEETVVKVINRQDDDLNRNVTFEESHLRPRQQFVDVYARAHDESPASSPDEHCGCRNDLPNVPTQRLNTHGSEIEILRKKYIEQQKTIAFLLEKEKRRDRERKLQKQRRSVSVTSLQASPLSHLQRAEENCFYEVSPNRSNTNIKTENIVKDQKDHAFIFPERRGGAGVSQIRSKSCDFLLDEERDPFLIAPPEHPVPVSSSGYGIVTEITSDRNNNRDNKEHLQREQMFNYSRGFVILLVVNAIIITLNMIGIPFLVSERIDGTDDANSICINCAAINYIYRDRFQKSDEKCCLGSVGEMLELFANVTQEVPEEIPRKQRALRSTKEFAMVQYEAKSIVPKGDVTRISWMRNKQNHIQRQFGKLDDNDDRTVVTIPIPGIYFIYSNIRFLRNNQTVDKPVTFGHSIVSRTRGVLGSAMETCFPTSNIARHVSHLSFMYNFTSKESLYVNITDGNDLKREGTRFGMFLLGTQTFQ